MNGYDIPQRDEQSCDQVALDFYWIGGFQQFVESLYVVPVGDDDLIVVVDIETTVMNDRPAKISGQTRTRLYQLWNLIEIPVT